MTKENIFNKTKLKEIDNLTNNLLGNKELLKPITNDELIYKKNNDSNIKIIPKLSSERRVPLNLTILPSKIKKIKAISKNNNLSVSALLEQIIDQL